MAKLVGFASLFAVGLVAAGALAAGGVADVTTTETVPVTTTLEQTTTAPATTAVTTVEQTTTAPAATTTSGTATKESSTPSWVWVVLGVLAAAVVGLIVALLAGRGGISAEDRQRRLDSAVGTWAAQGWAVVSQTAGSATMSRGSEVMLVSVDARGQVDARSVARP